MIRPFSKTSLFFGLSALSLVAPACGEDVPGVKPEPGSLLRIDAEPPGDHCTNGGQKIGAGRDLDDNGVLGQDEVETESYVCNGADGEDGLDGQPGMTGQRGPRSPRGPRGYPGADGAPGKKGKKGDKGDPGDKGDKGDKGDDGKSVLISVTDEPPGDNCLTGGQRVQTGVDEDRDGELDPDEVSQTKFICNGKNAGSGVAGFQLISKFTAPGGPIAEIVAATSDGMLLAYTSSVDQTVGFADIANPLAPVALGAVSVADTVTNSSGEPTSVAITPNGQYAVVAVKDTSDPVNNADPGALVFIDVATRTIVGQVSIGVGPDSVHVTPDGQKVVIAIEDEEDSDNNGVEQARPGSVQVVGIDYATPSSSTVTTIAMTPSIGNLPGDPQPEFVDITADGRTAIVSLQENNLIAVIDLETESVLRFIDAGTSSHARADLADDGEVMFDDPSFVGLLEPDSVCLLSDGFHFVTANEGDTPNETFAPGLFAGGRGFSVFNTDGERVFDSGDAAEFLAVRRGAYPDGRSDARGMEIEGCATGVFSGTDYAFLLGERDASLVVVDVSTPSAPALKQMIGAPLRPEGVITLPERNLVVVGGEGDDDVGGGIWIYRGVSDPADAGNGTDVYEARSNGTPFSALGALAYDPETGLILASPDNAFVRNRIWSFWVDHSFHRVELVSELFLKDASGAQLTGYDPEGIAPNPEGGFIVASEGIAGNGAAAECVGSVQSNRILFFDRTGRLDPAYGSDGIVDLPCGSDPNAIDWTTVRGNGYEGLTVVDTTPDASGGLKVFVAIQRALIGEGQNTRIGEYDVDTGAWNFYFYTLDPNPGGMAGNTFLSELTHVIGDTFVVVERDQGWSGEATNKTLRTFTLASGVVNDIASPVEKVVRVDLLAHPFRFDQEKIEGIALGGGSLFVTNDNDGGEALNFFLRLDPSVLLGTAELPDEQEPPSVPGQDVIFINEVNSQGDDFVELINTGASDVDLSGWKITDNDPTHVLVLPQGTVIAAGTVLLISGEGGPEPALSFGLGSADSAILYTPFDVVVDEHSWTSHVASASRCPDGSGVFVAPILPTPGELNGCSPPPVPGQDVIFINEVNSQGDDFVELINTGASDVDLSGWKITDNDPTHVLVLPQGTVIAAGTVLLISGEGGPEPALSFGLGSADSAILYTPFDVVVDEHSWTSHVASASRCPDGTGGFVTPTTATPGALNACAAP